MFFKLFGTSGTPPRILEQAVTDFLAMIEHCHWMHGRADEALWGAADLEAARTEIYQRDILVNQAERAVRKAIVAHLAVNPKSDTAFCLILMSVVKDAERVGDYCKNMMDLPYYHLPRRRPEQGHRRAQADPAGGERTVPHRRWRRSASRTRRPAGTWCGGNARSPAPVMTSSSRCSRRPDSPTGRP